jgi:phosphoribosylformylglycinamidine cyclo-ligase
MLMGDPISYADAGVDIDAGNALIDSIRDDVGATAVPGVLDGIGGFGALFALNDAGTFRDPVLVSGTDGVGTKLRLAIDNDRHDRVGHDLVAMCVNDIVVTGARPLFFLDYFATGSLSVEVAARVVAGIADGCKVAGCALVGGETAELPGFYAAGDYDLAGFSVGVVEREDMLGPSRVRAGDCLIGLPSSGLHSNGYSLARRLLQDATETTFCGQRVVDLMLEPTAIYARQLVELHGRSLLHAAAHITGGGLLENLPRALPKGLGVRVNQKAWTEPDVFGWIRSLNRVADHELYRTFNMGIGMVLIVAKDAAGDVLQACAADGAVAIGEVVSGEGFEWA